MMDNTRESIDKKYTLDELVQLSLESDDPGNYLIGIMKANENTVRCENIGNGRTVVLKYDIAHAILLDNKNFSSQLVADNFLSETPTTLAAKMKLMKKWPLYSDGETHIQIRKAMLQVFDRKLTDSLEPQIKTNITKLFSAIEDKTIIPVLTSISEMVPLKTFCFIMGIEDKYVTDLKRMTGTLQLMTEPNITNDVIAKIEDTWDELYLFFNTIVREKKYQDSVFIDQLVNDGIETDSIVNQCVSILFGAHETTTGLISNAILLLLDHKDQLAILQKDPLLVDAMIEEVLRYDPPAKITARVCLDNIVIGNTSFSKDEKIIVYINAANRDTEIFEYADEFRIERKGNRNISFGYGIHACIGAKLARIQAKIVVEHMLPYLHEFEVLEVDWVLSMVFRKMNRFVIQKHTTTSI